MNIAPGMTQADADAANTEFGKMKEIIEAKAAICTSITGIGQEAMASKICFTTAALENIIRGMVKPGVQLSAVQKEEIATTFGLTKNQCSRAINKFLTNHPEYKKGTQEFKDAVAEGARKKAPIAPNSAIRVAYETNNLAVDNKLAKDLSDLFDATARVAYGGMKKGDARIKSNDVEKHWLAHVNKKRSKNARTRASPANGKSNKRVKYDVVGYPKKK